MSLKALAISTGLMSIVGAYILGHDSGYKENTEANTLLKDKVATVQFYNENLSREVVTLKHINENVLSSRGASLKHRVNSDTFEVTAYSPYDNVSGIEAEGDGSKTSTGTKPGLGTIAVDPDVIPYGSAIAIIYSDGTTEYGYARDTGGAIKGNHIDVFRETYKQTCKFGKKHAVVIWYKED